VRFLLTKREGYDIIMVWDESKHPRDNDGKFARYNSMSIDELKEELTIKSHLLKIDLQFFTEKDIKNQSSNSLKRAIRNILHTDKINNPHKYIPEWDF
jgi:hypothetical protein